jgi:hypothetical protein
MQPTDKAAIPDDLDIAPSLVSYQYWNNQLVPVHISNVTTRTITVSPNAILCELQPVSVTDIDLHEDTSSDVLHNVTIPRSCRNIFHLCRNDYKRCIFA